MLQSTNYGCITTNLLCNLLALCACAFRNNVFFLFFLHHGGQEKEAPSSESVLQKKLTKLALRIGYVALAAAILCLVISTLKFSITNYAINGESARSDDSLQFLNFFITAITVVVVAVPEGLPLAVTIALAFSVQKMLKDNNLVRHLHSCETMGNATCICSDKTGTLTTNRMTVVDSYIARKRYTDSYPSVADLPPLIVEVMQQNIAVNSSYSSKLEPVSVCACVCVYVCL